MLLATWASPGHPFMDGVVGTDTIGTVKKTGDRSRDVTTPVTLRKTLVRVYADMINNNDAVLTCLGEAEVGADARTTQLKCIKK